MPTHLASLDSLVHPHQIEVQEFSSYALVIDARSAEAYQEDHIPGAVSVPVVTQRLSVVFQ
jgi:rhodanese-related sulfurtransferase